MASDSSAPSPSQPPMPPGGGLPPVEPPSGQMILRLFLVPGIIVAVLVALFLLGPQLSRWVGALLGRPPADARTADEFLRELDSTNPDIRYRAASDLAQVLLRKDSLAADPDFALALADRLQATLDRMAGPEKELAAKAGKMEAGERRAAEEKLSADRNLGMFLAACLGNCMIPAGAPLLERMASQESGMEEEALGEQRRRALFALATLGQNLTRYDRLSDEEKDAAEAKLAAVEKTDQATRARPTLQYLQQRRKGKNDTLGVAEVLVKCARDEDPSLRFYAAFASNFWRGTTAEDTAVEEALAQLAVDDGRGEDRLEERESKNPDSRESRQVTKRKGFGVQANATIAMANRGSPKVRLDLLKQMLSPKDLREVFVVRRRAGGESPNEAMVVVTLTNTLKAVAKLARQRPEMKARLTAELGPLVEALAKDENAAVSAEAEQAVLALR